MSFFTDSDVWHGGFYELALEMGTPSDTRLRAALQAVWSHPALMGCYTDRQREPAEQPPIQASAASLEAGSHLYGLIRLPHAIQVACGTCLVREAAGGDWLDFYLPMGALGSAYPVGGYPFDETQKDPASWQAPLDAWLAELGQHVFAMVPFRLGLIGFETSGYTTFAEAYPKGQPTDRYFGYLWPSAGKLEYLPKNK